MAYATTTQFTTYGLPATALGQLTAAQIQGALDTASSMMDGFFNGRPYGLPLAQPYPIEIVKWCCAIAAWDLMNVRGFNPASGADVAIRMKFDDAKKMLEAVQRKAYSPPGVIEFASVVPAGRHQPRVFSQSVTTATGRTASNRGW